MPISIWNDQPYDDTAIFTGSATVVDLPSVIDGGGGGGGGGTEYTTVITYPGLCNSSLPGCPGGLNLALATPSNRSDPLQSNWTKHGWSVNPVVPGPRFRDTGGGDPSSAWKTPAGEWRFTTQAGHVFGSMDFKAWYSIGDGTGFPSGALGLGAPECPSFFPLPRTTPGAKTRTGALSSTPTHVCEWRSPAP